MNEAAKQDRGQTLHQKVSDLESFVVQAIGQGARPKELKEICDDAVEHAKRKAVIIQHTDSALLLSALDQVREEICKLPEVTAANAEVNVQVMQAHLLQGKSSSEEVNPSVKSVTGPTTLKDRAAAQLAQSSIEAQPPPTPGAAPAPTPPAAAAAEVVQSLRSFAAAVAEEARARPGPSLRSLSMSMRRDKSSDFRKSREYDFETAQSPLAAYYMSPDDFNPFHPSGSSPTDHHIYAPYSTSDAPITTDYMLSSPRARAAALDHGTQSLPSGSSNPFLVDESEESKSALGGTEASALERSEMGEGEEGEEGEGEREPVGGGVRPGAAAAAAARGEGTHCASAVPPGLNPLAVVEGHSDLDNPHTPHASFDLPTAGEEDGPEVDLGLDASYEMLASHTPPKHVLQRLAKSIKRLSV